MSSRTLPGRILWGILGITTLAQPVCAAICPRGRGLCPYPGKCFLYVDGNSNSLCDYTRTAVTTPKPTVTSAVHTTTLPPVIEIAPSSSLSSAPSGTGLFELLQAHPLLVGIILFVCITGFLIWIYRHDIAGIKFRSFSGLLAFSTLIGLGISAIAVCLLMGETATGIQFAVLYIVAGISLTAYLWKSGNISRNVSRIIIIISALTGFVFLDILQPHPLLLGIILFVCITGSLIGIYRHDIAGIKFRSFSGLLAFSTLIGLGIAEIAVCLLMGEAASGTLFAVIYMITGTVLTAYLWKSGNISRNISRVIIVMSALTGFVFLAPLMPMEFTGMIHLALGTQALTPGILGILVVLILAAIAGRSFCAHICPVGSLQELASDIPPKKIDSAHTRRFEMIRFGVFIATVAAGLYFINLMEYTGIYDFFSLALTAGFFLFAALLLLSVLIYRPVCRLLCPYGVLFSLAGHFSRNRLVRTDACINCKKCERICPVHCAGKEASKRECYLCGRCTETCPVDGALVYKKR